MMCHAEWPVETPGVHVGMRHASAGVAVAGETTPPEPFICSETRLDEFHLPI